MSLFLLVNIIVLAIPLFLTQRKKAKIVVNFLSLGVAIIIAGVIFMGRNYIFVQKGLIDFNFDNLLGITFYDMPIEHYFFFVVFPYSFLFLYKWVKRYFHYYKPTRLSYILSFVFTITCIVLAFIYSDKPYAFTTLLGAGVLNWIIYFGFTPRWYSYFSIAFLLVTLPYILIDGTLTFMDKDPTTIYHEEGIIGTFIFTVPLEDMFNFFTLFLMTISIYEGLTRRIEEFKLNKIEEEVYQYK